MTSDAVNILERLANDVQLSERGLGIPTIECFLVALSSDDDNGTVPMVIPTIIDDNNSPLMKIFEPDFSSNKLNLIDGHHFIARVSWLIINVIMYRLF
jgi:hypothetical protein